MCFVYILFCSDRKLYIGYTTNIKNRIHAHKQGYVKATKHRRPLSLIYFESYSNNRDAKAREVYLKSGGGHQQIKQQHKQQLTKLGYLKD